MIAVALALLAAAAPLEVEVYVPLCDSALIACGRRGAGKPRDLEHNLYWGAAYGAEHFLTRAPGFTLESKRDAPDPARPGLLREVVLRRAPALREREVRVHLLAWAGDAIDDALAAFLSAAAGASRAGLVVWAGHDRLMDVAAPKLSGWPNPVPPSAVLACLSERYFGPVLRGLGARPVVLTRSLMAPEAYLLEALLATVARRGPEAKAELRAALVAAYARYQRISPKSAASVFSKLD